MALFSYAKNYYVGVWSHLTKNIITRENEKYIDICHFFTKSLHTLYFQQNESQHMALLFFRILENKLEYKYTADQIVDTMKKMNLTLLEWYGYIPSYTRTDITDDLHKLFGFRTDYQITKKQKMRNIIHQTKDKKKIL